MLGTRPKQFKKHLERTSDQLLDFRFEVKTIPNGKMSLRKAKELLNNWKNANEDAQHIEP